MDEKTEGIILRLRPLTETSLIVHWLTRDCGRIATVAKGARRPKSAFFGKLDLGHSGQLLFQRRTRSHLHLLKEVNITERPERLRFDVALLSAMAAAVELLERSTETDTPLPDLYELMRQFIGAVAQTKDRFVPLFAFQVRLLNDLGLPPAALPEIAPALGEMLLKLGELPWRVLTRVRLSPPQQTQIQSFLRAFIADHLHIRLRDFSI